MAKNTPIEVSKEAYVYLFPEQGFTETVTKIFGAMDRIQNQLDAVRHLVHSTEDTVDKLLIEVRKQRRDQVTPLVAIDRLFGE